MNDNGIQIKFWGVRGSIPAPISSEAIEHKLVNAIYRAIGEGLSPNTTEAQVQTWVRNNLLFHQRGTMGGNTTCVEVRCDDQLIILDMGTGLRCLGVGLMGQTIQNKGLQGVILQSHVHWDHIQGYPFWPQLHMPRTMFRNEFQFFGGKEWDKSLEEVLRGQMDAPVFPVNHREVENTGLKMHFDSVYDGKVITLPGERGDIRILCRKLNHPQETYGYRIEYAGESMAFCTDHEPYSALDRRLLELANGVDIFITECQYSKDEYSGHGGKIQKIGWGHSYPEYIAEVVDATHPKLVVTTHHDPASDDERVVQIASQIINKAGSVVIPGSEGLVLKCSEV